jgi:hypothetical protein
MTRLTSLSLLMALISASSYPFSGNAVTTAPFALTNELSLKSALPNAASIQKHDLFELTLDLQATFNNPFDPEDIDVQATFSPPKGEEIRVNGFLDQAFSRRLSDNAERIEPTGEPVWKIRFTPSVPGHWRYQVFVKTKTGSASLAPASLEVLDRPSAGFIRLSPKNPLGFAYEDGQPFFGVGENMCWGGARGTFDYDDWLPELAKQGGNFIRIWMSSWNCALEWSRENRGDWRNGTYYGVGVYSLGNAWKLDTILDIAKQHGVQVMLCLGTYGEFNDGGYFNEGQWRANPYNATNGGPCLKSEDFWTNAAARKLYRQRLRYLTARYGHRLNLHSWEFWNEAKAPAGWVAEMARYMKGTGEFSGRGADPYRHLLTTTYGDSAVWRLAEIDFTQDHDYGVGDKPDFAPVAQHLASKNREYGKPHWLGEFGIDWRSPDTKYDTAGEAANLHNTMWASVMSGDAGAALIWWWDSYIHPKRLYSHFKPIRGFVDKVPWTLGKWEALKIEATPRESVRAYGMHCEGSAIVWIQNTAHNWKNIYARKDIPMLSDGEVVLRDLPPGSYSVKWWDTYKGVEVTGENALGDGPVRLKLSALSKDVAVRLQRIEEPK